MILCKFNSLVLGLLLPCMLLLVHNQAGGLAFVTSSGSHAVQSHISSAKTISASRAKSIADFDISRRRRIGTTINITDRSRFAKLLATSASSPPEDPAINTDSTTTSAAATGGDDANSSSNSIGRVIAKVMGYMMGAGSILLFSPIIFTLISSKNADGFAISTWVMNLIGMLLAVAYPVKMGFPASTYVEVISVILQCICILGLVCFYRGVFPVFLCSVLPTLALFGLFLLQRGTPKRIIQLLQVGSIFFSTYANVPQIVLTFQLQKASWSWITAGLSASGCLVRVFTTMQLTKDKLALVGYLLGFVTNLVLLLQVFYFNHIAIAAAAAV